MSERKDDTEKEKKPNEEAGNSSSSVEQEEVEDSDIEEIQTSLADMERCFDSSNYYPPFPRKVLKELSIDGIVDYIKGSENCKIVTMAGAGISTSAGIPDFRSPPSGLFHNLEKYNLPDREAIFDFGFFFKNPEPLYMLAKELLSGGFKPTPCHYFIRLLSEKGLLLRHYTQNMDNLDRMTGLPPEKLVETNGTFRTGRCILCSTPYTFPWMKEKIIEGIVPKCEKCRNAVVSPGIVFSRYTSPDRYNYLATPDFQRADLLIIMGSSLTEEPFGVQVNMVQSTCPRLLINKEKVGVKDYLKLPLGLAFDKPISDGGRDVAWLGDCDTGIQLLAEKMGWADELKDLIKKEHERLDAKASRRRNTRAK